MINQREIWSLIGMLQCNMCGEDGFTSRNKLFAHVKICGLNRNPTLAPIYTDQEFFGEINREKGYFIYVTGGRVRGKTLLNAERYNIRTEAWEQLPNMLEHRGSHGTAAVGEYIYVIGGGGLHSNLSSVERLHIKGKEWEKVADMPNARHALHVISVGNLIYAVGGWVHGSLCSPAVECLDTITLKWTICADMPTPRRLFGMAHLHDKLYVFGGVCSDKIWNSDIVEVFDTCTNSWQQKKNMPIGGQTSAITIGDFIYVISHGNHIYRYDANEDSYTQISFSLPRKNWFGFDVTTVNDRIYFHGGNVDGVWSNELWKYDIYSNKWSQLESMKSERRRCSAAVVIMPITDAEYYSRHGNMDIVDNDHT